MAEEDEEPLVESTITTATIDCFDAHGAPEPALLGTP